VFDWRTDSGEQHDRFEDLAPAKRSELASAMQGFRPIDSIRIRIEGAQKPFHAEVALELAHSRIDRIVGADASCLKHEGRQFLWTDLVPPEGVDLLLFPRRRNTTMDWRVRSAGLDSAMPLQRGVFLGRHALERTAAIPRWQAGAEPASEPPVISIKNDAQNGRVLLKHWPRNDSGIVLEARYERPDYTKKIFPVFLDGFEPLALSRDRAWTTESRSTSPIIAVLGRTISDEAVYLLPRIDGAWPVPDDVVIDGARARNDELEFTFPHPLDGRITSALMSGWPETAPPGSITIRLETGGGAGRIDTSLLDPALVRQLEALGYVR
jgi:hypothetical protein